MRGDRLFLFRLVSGTADGLELAALSLVELSPSGRFSYTAWYDEDDLDAAIDELDTRFLDGEGAEHADVYRASIESVRMHRALDWEAVRESLTDDFMLVDHRELGAGECDRDAFIEFVSAGAPEQGELAVVVRKLHRVGQSTLATVHSLVTRAGNAYEWAFHALMAIDASGRVERMEWFAEDDFDSALARLDELGAADPRTPLAENVAAEMSERMSKLIVEGQHEQFGGLCVDDVVTVDRRSMLAGDIRGRDELLANNRALLELGIDAARVDTIAVRGSRLSLARITVRFNGMFEIAVLQVFELDNDGLLCRLAFFDEAELDAAIDELDARHVAGEGAVHAEVLRAAHAMGRLNRTNDFEEMRDLLSPDFVSVDHRPLAFGTLDRDHVLRAAGTVTDLGLADLTSLTRTVHVVGRAVLGVQHVRPVTEQGGQYDWSGPVVFLFDSELRVSRMETFAEGDFDLALARLDELGAADQTRPPYLDNAVMRAITVGGMADAAVVADDLVVDDRRSGVSLPELHGAEELVEASRAQEELFGPTVIEPVAVRGDRLALVRTRSVSESGFELVAYGIFETNVAGQLCAMVFFDETDLTTALEELDAVLDGRRRRAHGHHHGRQRPQGRVGSQRVRRDVPPPLVRLLLRRSPAARLRSGGSPCPRRGKRTRTQVAADGETIILSANAVGNALLTTQVSATITDQGSNYERATCTLLVFDESRRISRMEWFDLDRLAEARALCDELGAPSAAPDLENGASRSVRAMLRLAAAGDVDGSAELVTDDFEHVSRRSVVSSEGYRGRDAFIETNKAGFEAFPEVVGPEVIAIRGDRLALMRAGLRARNGFEVMSLGLYEIDATGAIEYWATFDDDDLAAALDLLNDRYIAGEGAEHEYLIRRLGENRGAFEARDWDAYEALIHPEFAFVDHRPIGQGSGNRDGLLTSLRALTELAPAFTSVEPSLSIKGDVSLTRVRDRATNTEGNEYEWEHFVVQQFVGGLVMRAELFPLDAYAEARARFDELAAERRTSHIDNTAVRVIERGRWRALFEPGHDRLSSVPSRLRARRPAAKRQRGELAGREDVAGSIQSGIDVFGALVTEAMAVRGEQLVLATWRFEQEGGFNAGGLTVLEVDELGRSRAIISFDDDDLASVIAELESRHRARGCNSRVILRVVVSHPAPVRARERSRRMTRTKPAKTISAREAAALVRSGDWLDYGAVLAQPDVFDQALAERV